jgi:hypothetical protein
MMLEIAAATSLGIAFDPDVAIRIRGATRA